MNNREAEFPLELKRKRASEGLHSDLNSGKQVDILKELSMKEIWTEVKVAVRCANQMHSEFDSYTVAELEEYLSRWPHSALLDNITSVSTNSERVKSLPEAADVSQKKTVEPWIEQVLKTLASDSLCADLNAFYEECTQSVLGRCLKEYFEGTDEAEGIPLARIVYKKFQHIVCKRILQDLHLAGYLRNTRDSKELLYDDLDDAGVLRFLKDLKSTYAQKKLARAPSNQEETNPFAVINRSWAHEAKSLKWFRDIVHNRLGYMDGYIAAIMDRITSRISFNVDKAVIRIKWQSALGIDSSLDLVADGQEHIHEAAAPLLKFIENKHRMSYVCNHEFDDHGNYSQTCIFLKSPSQRWETHEYSFILADVSSTRPNTLQIRRLCARMTEKFDMPWLLQNYQSIEKFQGPWTTISMSSA